MADEYKINIGTEADTSGAKDAEKAINQLGTAADRAADAVEAVGNESRDAAKDGKALNQSLDDSSQSAEGTRKILGGLSALMNGNLLVAMEDVTQGVRALNIAMLANPAGKLAAGFALVAGAVGIVAKAISDSKAASDAAAKSTEDLREEMQGAAAAAQDLGGKASAIDKIKEAIAGAASEAERFRKAKDESADIESAFQISEVDLKEAKGEISPDQARSQRTGIRAEAQRFKNRAANAADQFEITRAKQAQNEADQAAEQASARAERAKADLQRAAAEANASGAPTDQITNGDFAEAKRRAAENLKLAENVVQDPQLPQQDRSKMVGEAQKQVDTLDDLEAAYRRDREAREAESKAADARKKAAEETTKIVNDRTARIKGREKQSATLENKTATESQQLQNDQAKRKEAFEKEARENRDKLIEKHGSDYGKADSKPVAETDEQKAARERGEMVAGANQDARKIAGDAAGLSARSPEAVERLQNAAQALKDGATSGETDKLAAVLGEVATALERVGKPSAAHRALEREVLRLKGIVERLDNDSDT